MITRDYLLTLYDYNAWANKRALQDAASLSHEQLVKPQGYGWDSVQRTLVHIMSAEWVWLFGEKKSQIGRTSTFVVNTFCF